MKRIVSLAICFLMVFALSVPVFAAEGTDAYPYPGNYKPDNGYYYIYNVGEKGYLGAENTNDGIRFHIQDKAELFLIIKVQISTEKDKKDVYAYKIKAVNSPVVSSDYSIRVASGEAYPREGTEIDAGADFGLWHQRWAFDDAGNGKVYIRSYLDDDPNKGISGIHPYLNVKPNTSDDRVCLSGYDEGNNSQLWILERLSENPSTIKGAGTEANPYLISTSEHLTELAKLVADYSNYPGCYFKLTQNITYNGPKIGTENCPFSGIFDGYGHTITLNINNDETCVGLFAETKGAIIKNLEIAGSVSGKKCVGGIVGHAYENTRIDNCHVTATVTGAAENIGGVVGILSDSTVSNCRVDATVKGGWTNVGGIVGWLYSNSKVANCVKTGETIGYQSPDSTEEAAGGIVGGASNGDLVIAGCTNIGNITAFNNAGGIIGLIDDNVHTFRIYCCYVNCSEMWRTVKHARGFICGNNKNSSINERLEGSATHTVVAEQHYYRYVKADKVYQGNNFLPSTAVKTNKISETLKTINTYVNSNINIVPGVTLSRWSDVDGELFPESCKGFNVFIAQQNGTSGIGSILSQGSFWIIVAAAVLVLGGTLALVIVKKKNKPALASGVENTDEE